MMSEDEPHPLTRMVSIKSPNFWIFFGICALLYFYPEFTGGERAHNAGYLIYGDWACVAVFIALFLNILAGSSKNPSASRTIYICCYAFEAVSAIILGALIFFGHY